jgi:hypothetical protein
MELTGFAGKIIGLAVLILGYAAFGLGILYLFNFLIQEVIIGRLIKQFKLYNLFIQFVIDYYRKKAEKEDTK